MFTPFKNNLNEYYVGLFRENYAKRQSQIASLNSKTEAKNYITEVKTKISTIFDFPKKTLLGERIVSKHAFDLYSIENIVYYSRPAYPVNANLYLPIKFSGNIPAVLFLCRRSLLGKGEDAYRTATVGLEKAKIFSGGEAIFWDNYHEFRSVIRLAIQFYNLK